MKLPTIKVALLLQVATLIYIVKSQAFCTDGNELCLYSRRKHPLIEFRVETTVDNLGWWGIGFGNSMRYAEIIVGWQQDDDFQSIIQRRSSEGHVEPRIQPMPEGNSDISVIHLQSGTRENNTYVVTFLRPLVTPPVNNIIQDISNGLTDMIWAYSTTKPAANTTTLSQHSRFGVVRQVNLFAETSKSPNFVDQHERPPSVPFGNGDKRWPPDNVDSIWANGVDGTYRVCMIIHGVFMVFAWFVLAPIGIIASRFYKPFGRRWMVPFPSLVFMLLTCIFTLIGIAVGLYGQYVNVYEFSQFDTAFGAFHLVCGYLGILFVVVVLLSGIYFQKKYEPDVAPQPKRENYYYFMWKVTIGIAWFNTLFGFLIYPYYLKSESTPLATFFGLLVGLVLSGLFSKLHKRSITHDDGADDGTRKSNLNRFELRNLPPRPIEHPDPVLVGTTR